MIRDKGNKRVSLSSAHRDQLHCTLHSFESLQYISLHFQDAIRLRFTFGLKCSEVNIQLISERKSGDGDPPSFSSIKFSKMMYPSRKRRGGGEWAG